MKTPTTLTTAALALSVSVAAAQDDPVPEQFKKAYDAYKEKQYSTTIDELRAIIETLEKRTEKTVATKVLPDELGVWTGAPATNDDTSFVGGGSSVTRVYFNGKDTITVRVVKDSPLADQYVKMLSNKDLLKISGAETESIGGETAVVEGKDGESPKLRMAIDGRILVELKGSERIKVKELISCARKLDLRLLKKLK